MSRPVVLVTGASRGIGAATARLAAQRGYDVVINYVGAHAAAKSVAAEVEAAGGRACVVPVDVSEEAGILALYKAVDGFGTLKALVNNAGITGPQSKLVDLEKDTLERVLRLNVIGAMLVAREAVRRMSTTHGGSGGAIVNVSSRAAALGGAGEWLHYAASKGAIESFTLGLAREVGGEGIRINAVAPGLISTDIHAASGGAGRLERLQSSVPQNRIGTPEEVAATILWLLGEEAPYVTGASIPISGGR